MGIFDSRFSIFDCFSDAQLSIVRHGMLAWQA